MKEATKRGDLWAVMRMINKRKEETNTRIAKEIMEESLAQGLRSKEDTRFNNLFTRTLSE